MKFFTLPFGIAACYEIFFKNELFGDNAEYLDQFVTILKASNSLLNPDLHDAVKVMPEHLIYKKEELFELAYRLNQLESDYQSIGHLIIDVTLKNRNSSTDFTVGRKLEHRKLILLALQILAQSSLRIGLIGLRNFFEDSFQRDMENDNVLKKRVFSDFIYFDTKGVFGKLTKDLEKCPKIIITPEIGILSGVERKAMNLFECEEALSKITDRRRNALVLMAFKEYCQIVQLIHLVDYEFYKIIGNTNLPSSLGALLESRLRSLNHAELIAFSSNHSKTPHRLHLILCLYNYLLYISHAMPFNSRINCLLATSVKKFRAKLLEFIPSILSRVHLIAQYPLVGRLDHTGLVHTGNSSSESKLFNQIKIYSAPYNNELIATSFHDTTQDGRCSLNIYISGGVLDTSFDHNDIYCLLSRLPRPFSLDYWLNQLLQTFTSD